MVNRKGRSSTTILMYVSPYLYILPSAPSHFTSPGETSQHISAHNTENASEVRQMWLAIELACSSSLAPRYCDIRIAPAVVMPLPKLIRIFWKGETSVIADWFSVPILPSQKVSVRLYIDWIKLLIITGIASMRIARKRLPLRIIFLLSSLIGFAMISPLILINVLKMFL